MRGTCPCRGQRCKLDASDPRHGKRTGYAKHYCRCDDCLDAQAEYMDGWRADNIERNRVLNLASYHRRKRLRST